MSVNLATQSVAESAAADVSGERGSVLPLILGMFAIAAALTALLVDTAYMRVERLHADAWAEQVAIAAAGQVDLSGAQDLSAVDTTRVSLDEHQAMTAARTAVGGYPARDLTSRKLVRASFGDSVAKVTVQAQVRLPFAYVFLRVIGRNGFVTVRSHAAAAAYADPRR